MSETLGKYELRRILGKGAMGTVYEGYDPVIDRLVAIKTVRLVGADSEDAQAIEELERFRREAKAAGRLQHPNIVGVFDYGETDDIAYIVMEYVDGTTLKHVLDNGERYGVDDVVRLMDALLAGLQFSHDRGVVHRDIKPANVMLTSGGEIKIADFGIARIESSSFTQAGTILGTPAYMSPEQFMGQRVDARTDIYSTGVMLYQILTGEKPFDGGLTAIMHKVLNSEPLPPSALSVSVTPALDNVVLTAMAKQPDQRYPSASAFAAALRNALLAQPPGVADGVKPALYPLSEHPDDGTLVVSSAPVAAQPPQQPVAAKAPNPVAARARKPVALLAGCGAFVVLGLGGAAYYFMGGQHTTPVLPAPEPVAEYPKVAAPVAQPFGVVGVASAVSLVACSFLNVDGAGNNVALSGYVGAGAPQAALVAVLAKLPPSVHLTNTVQQLEGPYCPILDVLRPYHGITASQQGLALSLTSGERALQEGDPIALSVRLPSFTANLWTLYFSNDASAVRIYPIGTKPPAPFAPNTTTVLGDGAQGGPHMQVGAPFGTDLAVSVASSVPLSASVLPADGSVSTMVPALAQLLGQASQAGGQVAVALHPIITHPARH